MEIENEDKQKIEKEEYLTQTSNSIWIPKEVIPQLIIIVEDILEKIKEDMYEDWDTNDAIILGHFVLPVLKDNVEKGLNSDDLLDKGWMLLRSLLKKHDVNI